MTQTTETTRRILTDLPFEEAGVIAVDAGLVLVADPSYIFPGAIEKREELGHGDALTFYKNLEARNHDEIGTTQLGQHTAVAVQSGHGDGLYPVYVLRDEDGRVAAMLVDFLGMVNDGEQGGDDQDG